MLSFNLLLNIIKFYLSRCVWNIWLLITAMSFHIIFSRKWQCSLFKPINNFLPSVIKNFYLFILTQSANIGPQDFPRTSSSNVRGISAKDRIWPSRGRPDLTSRGGWFRATPGCSQYIPWRTFKTRLRNNVRSSSRCLKIYFSFFFGNLFDWPSLAKGNSTLKVYWKPSRASKIEHFLRI